MAAIELNDTAFKTAERLAQQQGRSIGDVVSDLVLQSAKSVAENPANSPVPDPSTFLVYEGPMNIPVFRASIGAPLLTSEMVKEMMNDFP